MSKNIFSSERPTGSIHVTSYSGPANTLERTRMRLQVETTDDDGLSIALSLGFNDVRTLRDALDRWVTEQLQREAHTHH